MNSQKLNEFHFLREITIVNVIRETGYSLQKTLQLQADEVPELISSQAVQHMKEYLSCHRSLFPDTIFLFPTEDGALFIPTKFKQNLRKLLRERFLSGWVRLENDQIQPNLPDRSQVYRMAAN